MELEFNVEDLLRKNNIESDRIEFKKGWNPDDIYRSICAYANDFDNIGGGYILIGVEEKDGVAIRPVHGVSKDMVDKIQKEMLGYNHRIRPIYFAKPILESVDGKNIIVIWAPTGIQRPYKVVDHITSKNDNNYKYRIRYGTSSIVPNPEQEKDPKNFIEIPPIKGTVPQIIQRTMEKLQDIAIAEYVQKVPDRMEANRFMSYPYEVLEEAVVNAFYHRDYMCYEPVEIEIEPDCIRITSHPGIDRSIPLSTIAKGERFKSKYYRNRRLGEFLKELDLTEGRCTGIPTIQEGLAKNGSPRAIFETDEDRKVLWVTIPIQPDYLNSLDSQKTNQGTNQAIVQDSNQESQNDQKSITEKEKMVIELLKKDPRITQEEIAEELNWKVSLVKYYVSKLRRKEIVERQGTSQNGRWKVNKH